MSRAQDFLRANPNGGAIADVVGGRFIEIGPVTRPAQVKPAPAPAVPEAKPDESAELRQKLEVAERQLAAARLDARIQQALNRALR